MKPMLRVLAAGLALVALVASACASSGGAGEAAGGNSTSSYGDIDPGFNPSLDPGDYPTGAPASTGIPGVIMVVPSYINGSEVASPLHSPPPCPGGGGTGFSMSIADDAQGYDTPQEAIDDFVAGHRDYGTGSTPWRIVYNGFEMTATSGNVALDIFGLPNANWIVDGGERC